MLSYDRLKTPMIPAAHRAIPIIPYRVHIKIHWKVEASQGSRRIHPVRLLMPSTATCSTKRLVCHFDIRTNFSLILASKSLGAS